MSKTLLSILAVGIVVSLVVILSRNTNVSREVEPSSGGQIAVSSSQINFGDIDQGNGAVSATVEIRNDGDETLEIYRISTSCGCTTAEMDQSPLQPDTSRPLTIRFDPFVHPDESGPITRVVYLQSSDPEKPEVEIEIIGNVIPTPL